MLSRNSETSSTYSLFALFSFFFICLFNSRLFLDVLRIFCHLVRSSRENKNCVLNICLPVCSEVAFNNIEKTTKTFYWRLIKYFDIMPYRSGNESQAIRFARAYKTNDAHASNVLNAELHAPECAIAVPIQLRMSILSLAKTIPRRQGDRKRAHDEASLNHCQSSLSLDVLADVFSVDFFFSVWLLYFCRMQKQSRLFSKRIMLFQS